MSRLTRLIAPLLTAGAAVTSCSGGRDTAGPIPVTVSIEPQRSILEAIGGERVTVSSLLANGEDPETYDPTIASLINLERSGAWFMVGNQAFEAELAGKIGTGVRRFDTSEGTLLITGTHGESRADDHDHDADEADEESHHGHHHHGGIDPHTWSSVRNLKIMASNMLAGLEEIDPDGSNYYRARHDSLVARLDSLDAAYARRLAGAEGMTFMVWHPSLSYFARDYGLRQIAVAADHRETSILSLQSTIDHAIDEGVTVFFEQNSYDPRLSATVKRHINATCATFNPLDYEWQKGLDTVVQTLEANIGDKSQR